MFEWLFGRKPSADSYFADGRNWQSVRSSNVEAIGFYLDTSSRRENVLGVRFKNGSEYHYYGVTLSVYSNFVVASSKGRYVWQSLRDRYSYRRVK